MRKKIYLSSIAIMLSVVVCIGAWAVPFAYITNSDNVPKGGFSMVIGKAFTVEDPVISSVDPATGSMGDEIIVYGFFFGTKKGKVTLGGKNCKVLSWTMHLATGESEIHFAVPQGLSSGTQELKVTNGVGSGTMNYTVE